MKKIEIKKRWLKAETAKPGSYRAFYYRILFLVNIMPTVNEVMKNIARIQDAFN